MGRTTKFPFLLSGRKSSVSKDADEKKDSPQWVSSAARQNTSNMSKVERLLGTTGLPIRPSPSYDTLERATLNSKPSYMTLTVSEASDSHAYSGSSRNDNHYRPPRHQSLRHQASSNVLGRSAPMAGPVAESSASLNTRDLRSEYSSATLRSYYEAHKAPLLVSQQTSNSAVRDMALRKGLNPILPMEPEVDPYTVPREDYTQMQNSVAPSTTSTAREHKQRRLDITSLFPRPRTSSGNALGSQGVVNSPSQLSLKSEFPMQRRQISSPNDSNRKTSRLQKKLQQEAGNSSKRPSNSSSLRRDDPTDNPKNNVRRPPKGVQNWFDGLLEEVDEEFGTDEDEVESDVHSEQDPTSSTIRSVPSIASTVSEKLPDPPPGNSRYFKSNRDSARFVAPSRSLPFNPLRSHPPEKQFRASHIIRSTDEERDANFGASDTDESRSRSTTISKSPRQSPQQQQPTTETRASPSVHTQAQMDRTSSTNRRSLISHNTFASGSTRTNKLADVNLRSSSALSLSSSSEGDGETEDDELDTRAPKVRDSIAISEISADNIMIGRARAFDIRSSDRRTNDSKRAPRPMNLRELMPSDITEELPPEPRSAGPTTTVAPVERTLQTFAASDAAEEPIRPHTSAADAPVTTRTSVSVPSGNRNSVLSDDVEVTGLGHKLMAVTPEEEALLEMMRSKRVAMAKHSFKEGYKTALQQEERRKLSPRPPSINHEILLAAVEAVVQATATNRQDHATETPTERQRSLSQQSTGTNGKAQDATITAESTFTEIMEAFPAPSPTNNRFTTTFMTRHEQRDNSPGFSAASSSRHGRTKRQSNLSTVSSSIEDTSGTSATSSSPMPKQRATEADEDSIAGDLSNASTIKKQDAMKRLSLAPVIGSLGTVTSEPHVARSEHQSDTRPSMVPKEQAQSLFGEIMIGASESIVGKNDTDDLSLPHLHDDLPKPAMDSAAMEALPSSSEEALSLDAVGKRSSMRIDVSANPRSRPTSFAAPESPRRHAERRISKGAEYRLIPKIPQASPTAATFPPPNAGTQLQNSGRTVSVPLPLHAPQDSAKPDPHGRPRMVSASSAPAPNVLERKTKPRTINIANVKKAFSVQRDPSAKTAPLPPDSSGNERISKRFSRSSLHSEADRLSKRFSRSSLHSKPTDNGQRSSVSEDVLNAWTSLGGWRGLEALRGEA